ncbi:MAG: hypothetical protein J6B92_08255 [Paraprevotella sp.]|nr:hypothetical protein [Paraprevotella sp.]
MTINVIKTLIASDESKDSRVADNVCHSRSITVATTAIIMMGGQPKQWRTNRNFPLVRHHKVIVMQNARHWPLQEWPPAYFTTFSPFSVT